ncbi:hypothetical protein GOODEAATRI_034319 [Goodea atripinnis]|uniref:Uncharacterized protein n=1 Tax=Goodea atripinnis TaxID=208336 RepID=A0ABV0MN04_9TELE
MFGGCCGPIVSYKFLEPIKYRMRFSCLSLFFSIYGSESKTVSRHGDHRQNQSSASSWSVVILLLQICSLSIHKRAQTRPTCITKHKKNNRTEQNRPSLISQRLTK